MVVRMIPTFRPRNSCIAICLFVSGWWYHTNVPPVDAHVWRQLHLSPVARCSDSYCIFWHCLLPATLGIELIPLVIRSRNMNYTERYFPIRRHPWGVVVSIIRAKRVSNCYIPPQKYVRVSCVRLILVLEGSLKRYCCRTLRQYDTRYVRTI